LDVDIFGRSNFGFIVIIRDTFDISNNKKKIFVKGELKKNGHYHFMLQDTPRHTESQRVTLSHTEPENNHTESHRVRK